MPIKKSAIKDLKKNKKRSLKNKRVKENLNYLIKKSQRAIEKKDEKLSAAYIAKAIKALDQAAQKGIIKKNNAARRKSRLLAQLKRMSKV